MLKIHQSRLNLCYLAGKNYAKSLDFIAIFGVSLLRRVLDKAMHNLQ